ncbi:MAG: GH25 family lysozyme [Eggerthellaceae bacterium]
MGGASERTGAEAYVSPYDWGGLQADGERLAYYEEGELRSDLGVDVSSHQGDIDCQAVADDGMDFAFVRLGKRGYTEGALYADELAGINLDGASAAGLKRRLLLLASRDGGRGARGSEFALRILDGRALDLPIVYDHEPVPDAEGRANHMAGEELAACARAFCERIEQAGYQAMVYGNKQDIARFDGNSIGNRPVWFAEYDVAVPTGQFDFALWQYTNGGTVAGIDTAVDLNIRFLTD